MLVFMEMLSKKLIGVFEKGLKKTRGDGYNDFYG